MPVKRDPSGHRSVEAEVEVPGTPQEVWRAIATGPGISSWFVPSRSDERVGGQTACDFGPGMESVAEITAWEPPRKYVAETEEGPGTVASEWIVEARDGGTCVVRVVHRWFSDSDEWDHEFEGHTYGWQSFFRLLTLYLTHFPGQPSAAFQLSAFLGGSPEAVWTMVRESLEVPSDEGASFTAPSSPAVVERLVTGKYSELLLRLDGEVPGLAHLFPMAMEDRTMVSVRGYLYGPRAEDSVEAVRDQWDRWLSGIGGADG